MDKFESQFEDLDVRTAYMGTAMDQSVAATTPEDEVNGLIQMVADEHGLALAAELDDAGPVGTKEPEVKEEEAEAGTTEGSLAARLAALHSAD
jgi:charged multivesicular body protein 1